MILIHILTGSLAIVVFKDCSSLEEYNIAAALLPLTSAFYRVSLFGLYITLNLYMYILFDFSWHYVNLSPHYTKGTAVIIFTVAFTTFHV